MKEAYPKPGQQRRVPRIHPTSEYPSPDARNNAIIARAVRWSVRHPVGDGKAYTLETDNFLWAVDRAYHVRVGGGRVMLNAIDGDGNAALVVPEMWLGELNRWTERNGVQEQATRQPEGANVQSTERVRPTRGPRESGRVGRRVKG